MAGCSPNPNSRSSTVPQTSVGLPPYVIALGSTHSFPLALVCTAAPERASARTLSASPRVAAFVVRNTIREASCYLRVLGDLFSLPAEKLPPMLVATQAHPHCRDPATNGGAGLQPSRPQMECAKSTRPVCAGRP